MNVLIIYMVKVALYIIAFYLVYSLLLSRDTSYYRNRIFILLAIMASLIFPFITLQTVKPWNIQFFGKLLEDVFVTATSKTTGTPDPASSYSIMQLIYATYIIVAFIFIFKLLSDLIRLLLLIIHHKVAGSRIIRFHGFNTSGFSAMGYIFINSMLSSRDAGDIIRHEQNHIRQYHFGDIVFIEFLKALQWFNPAIYLFDRSLRAIHEFQADKDCLSSGVPLINYQYLLLNQVFKSRVFSLTTSFSNPSLIKRRMVMMTKKRTSTIAGIKMLIAIPVTWVIFMAISAYREIPETSVKQIIPPVVTQISSADSRSELMPPPPPPPPPGRMNSAIDVTEETGGVSEPEPFIVVEEMPSFPGGELALKKFLTTVYPENARKKNLSGKVIVRFCVTADGNINQISVLKSVSPELDDESIRVVKSLPAFRPGKQGGVAVPVWYMVPIVFNLK